MRVKHIRASALQELWVVPRNFSSQFRIFWTGTFFFFIQIPDSEKKMEVNLFMNERLENIRQEISDGVKSLTNSKEVYEFKKKIYGFKSRQNRPAYERK